MNDGAVPLCLCDSNMYKDHMVSLIMGVIEGVDKQSIKLIFGHILILYTLESCNKYIDIKQFNNMFISMTEIFYNNVLKINVEKIKYLKEVKENINKIIRNIFFSSYKNFKEETLLEFIITSYILFYPVFDTDKFLNRLNKERIKNTKLLGFYLKVSDLFNLFEIIMNQRGVVLGNFENYKEYLERNKDLLIKVYDVVKKCNPDKSNLKHVKEFIHKVLKNLDSVSIKL